MRRYSHQAVLLSIVTAQCMGCHSPAGVFWSSLVAALDSAAHPEVTDNQDEQTNVAALDSTANSEVTDDRDKQMWQLWTQRPVQRLLTTGTNKRGDAGLKSQSLNPEYTDNQDNQTWQLWTQRPMQSLLTTGTKKQTWQLLSNLHKSGSITCCVDNCERLRSDLLLTGDTCLISFTYT